MSAISKNARYERIYQQLEKLMEPVPNHLSRMSTMVALLHHKMADYFWTGFYFLEGDELVVGPYQGPLACLKLKKNKGVCWAGINGAESVVVPDVNLFPGHIGCSALSRSEIVVPVPNKEGKVVAILDVDSRDLNSFDEVDRLNLEKMVALIYAAQ